MELLDAFYYEQDFKCLCMRLFNATLLDLIVLPEFQAASPTKLNGITAGNVGVVVPQPR